MNTINKATLKQILYKTLYLQIREIIFLMELDNKIGEYWTVKQQVDELVNLSEDNLEELMSICKLVVPQLFE